jgi:hypothetical protein
MVAKFALACSSIEVEKLTRSISTDFGVRLPSELLKELARPSLLLGVSAGCRRSPSRTVAN